jgi:transcriptional regulator with XRE-family HTH domain
METFGEWLRAILREEKISQKDLADRIELTPAQISRIISGDRGIELKNISKIARVIHCPPEEVYRRAAGLLSPKTDDSPLDNRIKNIVSVLPTEEDKKDVLAYVELRQRIAEERGRYGTKEKRSKPSRT